ncbi:MAG: aspartate kinase [Oscillospiraceae bacterium]|nr:aspartate kinase [Oscillospiraceae bacterium]
MTRVVKKYGGSSVADAKKLYAVARAIAAEHRAGNEVVAVLSAQGGGTNALLARAREIDPDCSGRELDALLATGEQCSVSLCAMALQRLAIPAVSLSGWQAGIETEEVHGSARIMRLSNDRIERELAAGRVVLVAGFQGLSPKGDITTLGRGGSDTTAVALAAFLKADRCQIFTDVDGVYDTDPNRYPDAVKYDRLSYDEMLTLARSGARVLHDRCVEFAKKYGVEIEVRSSFGSGEGTIVAAP